MFGAVLQHVVEAVKVLPDPSLVRDVQPPGPCTMGRASSCLCTPGEEHRGARLAGWRKNPASQQSESNSYVLTTNLLFTFSRICFSFRAMASPFLFLIRFFSSFLQAYIFPVARTWQAHTWREDKAQNSPTAISRVGVEALPSRRGTGRQRSPLSKQRHR